ncbi:uncharacterized protein BT62DRAFT_1007732 [Guyanagaster necrorhizus]|uniref:Uncharacterized protein n=1 Tax=Guyanagaster necrorhizus TaxID=856835 RepID=A0A9P7VNZ2_9AGAR|nr:uncharacterized protein BT62DRAFT_1007732 [Guyanagaster necrorhizus MCA 3950]KAG7444703.1 hypothetical protein BT62DRAFT_1007732 [Guyanagaster necrorhizus MCA 3950]
MPKEEHEGSEVTIKAGLAYSLFQSTTQDATARNGLPVSGTEAFEQGQTTRLSNDIDWRINLNISLAEANHNASLPEGTSAQDVRGMKATDEVGQMSSSTCSNLDRDQFSSMLQNNSNDITAGRKYIGRKSATISGDQHKHFGSYEDYRLAASPDSGAMEHPPVIPKYGSRDPTNQPSWPSDMTILNESFPFLRRPASCLFIQSRVFIWSYIEDASKGTFGFPVTISPTSIDAVNATGSGLKSAPCGVLVVVLELHLGLLLQNFCPDIHLSPTLPKSTN